MKSIPRRLPRALLAAAWLLSLAALLTPAVALKGWVDARAASGASYFFTLEICRVLRNTLLTAGPALTAALWAWKRLATSLPDAQAERGARWRFGLAQALWILGLVSTGLARMQADPPVTKDTKFYLSESLEIARAGGPAALPGRCFSGDYRADNRHPLYPGALALVAEESDRFSDRARMLSLAGAALALLLATSWMRRVWGEAGGLVGGTLLVTNGAFLEQSRLVACESWMMAFAVPWFFLAGRTGDAHRLRSLALAGVLTGLMWLTKGTGTLYLAATLVALVADRRAGFWRPVAVYISGFTLTALPLLWRNVIVFGNPFHNINSSRVFWLDRWEQFFEPAAMQAAGPRHWLATHDLGDFVERVALGSFKVALNLMEALSPWTPALGLGLPFFLVGLVCAARDRPRRRWLVLTLFALFFASFAWYAKVVAGPRFLAPLVPLLLAPLAMLGPALCATPRARRTLWIASLAVGAALIVIGVARGALAWRPARFVPLPESAAVQAFLREHVGMREDVHYLLGPSDHYSFDWDDAIRGTRHSFPRDRAGLSELLARFDGPKLRYAIVAAPDAPRRFGVEGEWVRVEADGSLSALDPPPEWHPVRRIPDGRPKLIVFERRRAAPEEH